MSLRWLVNGQPPGSSERKFRSFAEGLSLQAVCVDAKNLLEEIKLLTEDRSKLGRADAVLHLAGKVFWLKEIVTIFKFRWLRGWV